MSKIPGHAREAVRFRDANRCVLCSAWDAHEVHHRMRRREGGHNLSVLVLLCRTCHHEKVHANPEWARERGLIVPTWGDTKDVPVTSWRGIIWLDDEGGISFVEPTTE